MEGHYAIHPSARKTDYYAETDDVFYNLYAITTIITPHYKLQFLTRKD